MLRRAESLHTVDQRSIAEGGEAGLTRGGCDFTTGFSRRRFGEEDSDLWDQLSDRKALDGAAESLPAGWDVVGGR